MRVHQYLENPRASIYFYHKGLIRYEGVMLKGIMDVLTDQEIEYMESMYEKYSLTARTYHKVLRVARTLADMDLCSDIRLEHLQEALCYRGLDKRYWEEGI